MCTSQEQILNNSNVNTITERNAAENIMSYLKGFYVPCVTADQRRDSYSCRRVFLVFLPPNMNLLFVICTITISSNTAST
jgi:hypothetical protein